MAGNVLMLGTVHGVVPLSGICMSANFKLLQYSGIDEATIFTFGKWIDYGKSHCRGKKTGVVSGHVTAV